MPLCNQEKPHECSEHKGVVVRLVLLDIWGFTPENSLIDYVSKNVYKPLGRTEYSFNSQKFHTVEGLSQYGGICSGDQAFSIIGKFILDRNTINVITMGKAFTSDSDFSNIRVWSGEQLYPCNACRKGFTPNSELTEHERIHSGNKLCAIMNVGKSFWRYQFLQNIRKLIVDRDTLNKMNTIIIHVELKFYLLKSLLQ